MPYKITFNVDGTWIGGGRIPPELHVMENFAQWTKTFLIRFNSIGKLYGKYFYNDGHLLGQEKANLVSELDGLIAGLLLLRRYVTKDNPAAFEAYPNKFKFIMSFKIDSSLWYGQGKIRHVYTFRMPAFADWYNNILMTKIKQVFNKYSLAMADGVLSDDEREDICRFIEILIFDIIVIEKELIYSNIAR
ncbi:MAG: hypothetical protein JW969_07390 [Spirochaetales bacterium]|nr:hypothetical protein [Spirochaetales bacterium]